MCAGAAGPSCPLCRTSYDVLPDMSRHVHLERTLQSTHGASDIAQAVFEMPDLSVYYDSSNVIWDPEAREMYYCEPDMEVSDDAREIDYPSDDGEDYGSYCGSDCDSYSNCGSEYGDECDDDFGSSNRGSDCDDRRFRPGPRYWGRAQGRRGADCDSCDDWPAAPRRPRTLPTWPAQGLGVAPSDPWSNPWTPVVRAPA